MTRREREDDSGSALTQALIVALQAREATKPLACLGKLLLESRITMRIAIRWLAKNAHCKVYGTPDDASLPSETAYHGGEPKL